MKPLLKKLAVPILVAVVTLAGNYGVQRVFQSKAKPILTKNLIQTDLTGLSPDIRRQITLIPITYSLQNNSQNTANNVTVFVKSDALVAITDIKFAQDSEDHQFTVPDPHQFKINVPTIRPNGILSFQILTTTSNNITFSELSDNALFLQRNEIASKTRPSIIALAIAAFTLLIWLPVIGGLTYVFVRVAKSWPEVEANEMPVDVKRRFVYFLALIYIYDQVIVGGVGMFSAWVPLPRIQFGDLLNVFLLYILVTRLKLIDRWLLNKHKDEVL